ncbi:unnamed protein product [Heligmosomoides polygyrus]|uniref:LemA family protein n=1 Tax=Heligmosomoides polygyrus TaxID=6339 RepID=A0A183FGX8_HELPZ|nr:unnamed protein product [Heligmosomoides polygyrus]
MNTLPIIIINLVSIPLLIMLLVAYFSSARRVNSLLSILSTSEHKAKTVFQLASKVQAVEENTLATMDSILAMSIPMQLTKEINACALEYARNVPANPKGQDRMG